MCCDSIVVSDSNNVCTCACRVCQGQVLARQATATFDLRAGKMSRLGELRGCMRKVKDALDAYIILTDDAHQVSRWRSIQ